MEMAPKTAVMSSCGNAFMALLWYICAAGTLHPKDKCPSFSSWSSTVSLQSASTGWVHQAMSITSTNINSTCSCGFSGPIVWSSLFVTKHFQTKSEKESLSATMDIIRRCCNVSVILAPRYKYQDLLTYILPSKL